MPNLAANPQTLLLLIARLLAPYWCFCLDSVVHRRSMARDAKLKTSDEYDDRRETSPRPAIAAAHGPAAQADARSRSSKN